MFHLLQKDSEALQPLLLRDRGVNHKHANGRMDPLGRHATFTVLYYVKKQRPPQAQRPLSSPTSFILKNPDFIFSNLLLYKTPTVRAHGL